MHNSARVRAISSERSQSDQSDRSDVISSTVRNRKVSPLLSHKRARSFGRSEVEMGMAERLRQHMRSSSLGSLSGDIGSMAHKVADKAEEIVKQIWYVVHHHHLPDWLRDNEFLVWGHRPQLHSFKACFQSIFRLHTETVNIWTHLLGFIAFVVVALVFVIQDWRWQEKVVFSPFFVGAIVCLGFSWTFHTVYCHSERVGRLFNKLDYCGITILTIGSAIPWLHYSFYCSLLPQIFYICMMVTLGIGCIVVSLMDKFCTPEYRTLRAALFVCLGLSGIIPCSHYIILEGFWHAWSYASLSMLALMAALYVTGALVYAMRVPERFYPGVFDIWFQSHQIFHVFVVAAAVVHYIGITRIAQYRQSVGTCIAATTKLQNDSHEP